MSLKPTTRALIQKAQRNRIDIVGKRNRKAAANGIKRARKQLGSAQVRANLAKSRYISPKVDSAR